MPDDIPESKQLSDLRKRAEKALQERRPDNLESTELSNEEMHSLIHELQVHQIELEMQNEELCRLQNEIEESRNKYSHLYDFAPVGYFTVKRHGVIEQANLTGAALLGIDRQFLIGKPLTRFITSEDQDTFYLHHLQVLKKKGNHTCEIKMMNFDFRDSDTLGVKIVKALAEHQLDGTVTLDSTNGAKFLIRFKERSHQGVI